MLTHPTIDQLRALKLDGMHVRRAGSSGRISLAPLRWTRFGFLNPLLAAGIHVVSELIFILNSARLLPTPERKIKVAPELKAELVKA